jgi:hypothetical protein
MPARPTWFARVPHILGSLQAETAPPFLDRPAVEILFGVRRRQAIRLLRRCGGYQVGRTFLVPRESVLLFLAAQQADEELPEIEAQKQHVADFLGQARQSLSLPRIRLSTPKPSKITFAGLPPGIHLTPGRLAIEFESATELLEKLFSLSQALVNDFAAVERAWERPPHEPVA